MKLWRTIFLAVLFMVSLPSMGQIVTSRQGVEHKIDVDSIINDFDSRPAFGIYKDTYFVGGTALNHKPTEFNSDVKFQISFRHRLTKSILPLHSHLFLQYSQKAIWNVFEESLPFHDLNFNPGIGIQNLVVYNGKLVGNGTIMLEHESNGRDGEASRSWNKVSISYAAIIDPTGSVFQNMDSHHRRSAEQRHPQVLRYLPDGYTVYLGRQALGGRCHLCETPGMEPQLQHNPECGIPLQQEGQPVPDAALL